MSSEYFVAFRRFVDIVGKSFDAVKIFPMVANLSLCSHSPPEAFLKLANAYRSQELTEKTNLPDIVSFCRTTDKEYRGFSLTTLRISEKGADQGVGRRV
jgi:hypothetical protein